MVSLNKVDFMNELQSSFVYCDSDKQIISLLMERVYSQECYIQELSRLVSQYVVLHQQYDSCVPNL